jgi:hypothetical protein
MRRIGVLVNRPADDPDVQHIVAAFLQELQLLGWRDGNNVQIEYRFAAAQGSGPRHGDPQGKFCRNCMYENATPRPRVTLWRRNSKFGDFVPLRIKGASMVRIVSGLTVLALAGALSGMLTGHLSSRYSEETQALGFSGIFERVLAAQAGFGDDAQAYRAATSRTGQASALEE